MPDTATKARRDTPTMRLTAEKLHAEGFDSLRGYLAWAREQINEDDGSKWSWDDIAFDVRKRTDNSIRATRESVRQWADRYGLLPVKEKQDETPAEA
jgi:hypothetical protein